jgi:large subunit ribosomal protein L13e
MLRPWSQEAGIPRKLAPTIGIPVDPRRQNLSTESLTANVERLKAYRARLILFPRKSGQHKQLDSSKEDLQAAKDVVRKVGAVLPIDTGVGVKHGFSEVKRSEMPESTEGGAYRKLRDARSEARLVGVREKRAKLKAEEAEAKKGK